MKNRPPALIALVCALGIFTSARAQTPYNIYFGDNHTHSWYSDGNQDQNPITYTVPVARSITWARTNRSSFDFLGISDHNHNESLNMTLAYWRSGHREADSVNQDGNFVGMYGQEWGTISAGGHVLVYGTDKLFGWNPGVYDVYVAKGDYNGLFTAVRANNGYCYLAHPQSGDYDGIFTVAYNANWDSVVQGVSMKSGDAFSTNTTETDPDLGDFVTQYHQLLYKGYHVAPIANQDNHYTTFGKSNQQRTGLLATSLTKANVDDAFRNRRVYAVEDHNLQVQFEVGTHRMGEIFSMAGSIPIRVKAIDAGESISRIEIRYGVPGSGTAPTTLQYVTGRDSLVFTQTQTIGTTYYYYAYVVEADGHRAWTAPMWITISSSPPPGSFALLTPANASTGQPVAGTLRWQTSSGATSYDVYLGTTNPPTTKVSTSQTDTFYNYSGLNNNTIYYWKVTAKNAVGSTDATGSPWNFTTIQATPTAFNLLSPTNGSVNQSISGSLSWQVSTNATGYDVYLSTTNPPVTKVSSNQPGTSYIFSDLLYSTNYYWKVVAKSIIDSITSNAAPWNFTTVGTPPGAFQLLSPLNDAVGQMPSGTLVWNTSENAVNYDIYIDTHNPPVVRVDSNRTDTSYSYSGLNNGTIYYWKIIAKNSYGTISASNAPRNFTTASPPVPPSNVSPSQITTNSLRLNWTDNAPDETGYRIYRSLATGGPYAQVDGDLPPSTTTFTDNDLQINNRYYYRILPFNDLGEGNYASINLVTLAAVPNVPGIANVHARSLTLTIDPNSNPSATQFAIKAVEDTVVRFVQQDGMLGLNAVWQTYSEWGGVSGIYLSWLTICKNYSINVKARNLDNIETAFGVSAEQQLPCNIATLNIEDGWNLVSIPVLVADPQKTILFPTSISDAFAYSGNYELKDSLYLGVGYWLKYTGANIIDIIGDSTFVDTIPLVAGWNMIGSITKPVNISNISTEPASIISSDYFSYSGTYIRSDSIITGKGYWVKSSSNGALILSSSENIPKGVDKSFEEWKRSANAFTFEDIAGHKQTLFIATPTDIDGKYELPPVPPLGSFDVRFQSQKYVDQLSSENDRQEFNILLQSIHYPVKLSWTLSSTDIYSFKLSDGKKLLGASGSLIINNQIKNLSIIAENFIENSIPKEFVLFQNYPNPFNPSTSIRYAIPSKSYVQLRIYNLLGEVIAILADEVQDKGFHMISWQPDIASGIYYYRMDISEPESPSKSKSFVKNLIYLR